MSALASGRYPVVTDPAFTGIEIEYVMGEAQVLPPAVAGSVRRRALR